MPLLESRYSALWVGKQTAKGTPNTAPSKRLVQVGGDFGFSLDNGSENYSDLSKYGAQTDWVNSLIGQGTPAVEATPTELAYLLWIFHGGETVASVTGPPTATKHTYKPSAGPGFWATFMRRVGQNVIQRHTHADCKISQVVIEGSTAQKAVRITPTVMSLDPGAVSPTVDPTAVMPLDRPFLYTDGSGAFTIDGAVFRGQSQFTFTVNEDLSPVYGDDIVPFDIVQGNAVATIGATILMDSDALGRWNQYVYGTPNPAVGTRPRKAIPALGSYAFTLTQRDASGALNGRAFALTIPGVRWTPPDAPAPNPDGGSTEIALAGSMRPVAGLDPYTIDVSTAAADVAFTV